jgi:hypothetical protein
MGTGSGTHWAQGWWLSTLLANVHVAAHHAEGGRQNARGDCDRKQEVMVWWLHRPQGMASNVAG